MTSSTLYVGTLFAFGSYMGFAKLNAFSSLNIFPVLKLVSANGSGWDCSGSIYIHYKIIKYLLIIIIKIYI